MSLVFVKLPEKEQTPHRSHQYSHIECDVPDCGARAPTPSELPSGKSLFDIGWFLKGGQHRCPDHFDVETPAGGPQYRDK